MPLRPYTGLTKRTPDFRSDEGERLKLVVMATGSLVAPPKLTCAPWLPLTFLSTVLQYIFSTSFCVLGCTGNLLLQVANQPMSCVP